MIHKLKPVPIWDSLSRKNSDSPKSHITMRPSLSTKKLRSAMSRWSTYEHIIKIMYHVSPGPIFKPIFLNPKQMYHFESMSWKTFNKMNDSLGELAPMHVTLCRRSRHQTNRFIVIRYQVYYSVTFRWRNLSSKHLERKNERSSTSNSKP